MPLPKRIFVTGTSTDIGKTVIAGILVAGQDAHYWKPVQTGLTDGTDTDWIRQHAAVPATRLHPETYSLQEPLSPHAAAELENVEIGLGRFVLPEIPPKEPLVVEGAGGIMVPLNREHYMLDLIKLLDIPVLLVVDSQLGTINHTLLTLLQLQEHVVPVTGVVMNGPRNAGNREAIEYFGEVPVIAEVEPLDDLGPASLADCFKRCFAG